MGGSVAAARCQDTFSAAPGGSRAPACARYHTPRYSASASSVGRGLPAGMARAGNIAQAARRTRETCLRRETQQCTPIPASYRLPPALGIAGAMAFSQAHAAAFLLKIGRANV